MTQLPLTAYFHDPQFRLYFLNCVGDIHYILPGVFIHNPFPQYVNSQLWTVPLELQCYAILAVLGLLGIAHRRALFLPVALAVFGAIVFYYLRHNDHNPTEAMRGHNLIPCFLFGVLAYNFRSILPYNRVIAILAFVAAVWLLLLPSGRFLAPLPIAYVVVFLGCANPRIIGILETGDYSYGIYLYGFPIQQAVVATGWFPANRWIHLAVALPLVVLVAVCSWHLWEKHWLKLKRFRPNLDGWFSVTKPGKLVGQIYRLALAEKI